jgi:hypothetical protein
MKGFVNSIVHITNPDVKALIATFSDDVVLANPLLTNDRQQLCNALTMIDGKNSGCTLAGHALMTVGGLLRGPTVPEEAAVGIVLLTDGDVSDVTPEVKSFLIQNRIKVLAVGIGKEASSVMNLIDCTTVLHLPNWQSFSALSLYLSSPPSAPPALHLLTIFTRGVEFEVKSSDEFSEAIVELYYGNAWHAHRASGSRVRVSNLSAATHYEARCRVTYKGSNSHSAWSEIKKFTTLPVHKLSNKLRDPQLRDELERRLRDKIRNYRLPAPLRALGASYINILLLAYMGNGKTAFVNGVNSAVKGEWAPLGVSKKSPGHVTTKYTQYMLTPHISLGDTIGVRSGMSNLTNILDMMISGTLSFGYEENKPINEYLNTNPSISQRAGAVILLVEMNAVYLDDQMADCRNLYDRLTNAGVQVFFLMTKLDTSTKNEHALKFSDVENLHENFWVKQVRNLAMSLYQSGFV